jgi:hypothetical protein
MSLVVHRFRTIGHTSLSGYMSNYLSSPMSRRGLLRFGLLATACGVAGCGEPGVIQVEKPAVEKGARRRLDMLKEKADQAATKKK